MPDTTACPAGVLRRDDIGRVVTIRPTVDEPPAPVVTGVIRWLTFTSDEVIVAIEEPGDAAVEWTLRPNDVIQLEAHRHR